MSKNYIEQFMDDNDLKNKESFNIKAMNDNPYYFNNYRLYNKFGSSCDAGLSNLLQGDVFEIEKIKTKTLMQQLMLQGYGWLVTSFGKVDKVQNNEPTYKIYLYQWAKQGNIFLNKSDAEKKAFYRELKFDIEEWAREHDCLGLANEDTTTYSFHSPFNIIITKEKEYNDLRGLFKDRINKYYNWNE